MFMFLKTVIIVPICMFISINAPIISAVAQLTIDNVKTFAVDNMTETKPLGFKREYFFRTCSVATNLLASPKFIPVRCATMLCHFGQTRNDSVAIHFFLRGSALPSSATGEYAAVLERFGQNEEPVGSNEERTRKKASFVPRSRFKRCTKV